MKLFKLIATAIIFLTAQHISAHTMWIEVDQNGQKGTPATIKVFFGEYSWGRPTNTEKWFSDIKDYKLTITAPDGNTTILNTKTQDSLYYASEFTPTQEGVYIFSFKHIVKDVYKDKRLTYISAAYLNVNASKKVGITVGEGQYQLYIPNPKNPNHIIFLDGEKPGSNQELEIIEKGNEKALSIKTDAEGILQFPKEWKGNFLIEIPDSQKTTPTEHNGKTYGYDYATFSYYVKL